VNQITAQELNDRIGAGRVPFILDVREPNESAECPIPDSLNIPLRELSRRAAEIPRDEEIVVVCTSGGRSAYATDVLTRAGHNATNLTGGTANWQTISTNPTPPNPKDIDK